MNREAFEAWIMRTARRAGTHVNKDTTGKYLDNRVDAKWSAWQAAIASQAQQESQWISVEERLPEGDVFVDVYIRSRSNTNFMQRETSVAFVSGKFKINRIFDCEYVSHWMPIPPAPEGEKP